MHYIFVDTCTRQTTSAISNIKIRPKTNTFARTSHLIPDKDELEFICLFIVTIIWSSVNLKCVSRSDGKIYL